MSEEINLDLPWPPTVNSYYGYNRKTGKKFIGKEGLSFRKAVMQICLFNRTMNRRIQGPVKCHIDAHMPDKKIRDLDNLRKAVYDAITAAGVWEDDKQVFEDSARKVYPPVKGGLLRVTISPLHQAT